MCVTLYSTIIIIKILQVWKKGFCVNSIRPGPFLNHATIISLIQTRTHTLSNPKDNAYFGTSKYSHKFKKPL